MPINFFQAHCKSSSNKKIFGVCDDVPNSPAYIDETTSLKWIAIVSNAKEKEIEFYAIDNCLDIRRPNGDMESRCDGVLTDDKKLIFVELKERESGQWFKKGREQLTTTLNIFLTTTILRTLI